MNRTREVLEKKKGVVKKLLGTARQSPLAEGWWQRHRRDARTSHPQETIKQPSLQAGTKSRLHAAHLVVLAISCDFKAPRKDSLLLERRTNARLRLEISEEDRMCWALRWKR